ncbi:MAG: hypothetical protein K9N09_04855 [Candidatus Cloacimonetes bacterium]|nr:hypothetical protein [Candidatus Cloacimonadota bacterium]MCF7868012.1 hypothetical protein [Candidatus Cloacimonadota bacterium]MCF7883470.1 hypothetical protein [Candidatus Cloacimonadota bacterium]
MAKIVYGLSGEGSGHSSRSREMISHLTSQGHQVKVASYDRGYRNLKDDYEVMEIEGFSIVSKDNKVSITKTFTQNFSTIFDRYESINILKKKYFKDFQPDAVITDFEPMTAYLANELDVPLITIDNQHRLRYMDFPCPLEWKADAIFIENLVRAMIPRPCVSLITTFYFGKKRNDRTFLFPPILRKKVLDLKASANDYILVYVTAGFETLIDHLRKYNREKFYVYGYNKDIKEGNLVFRPFSKSVFLNDLAGCKGVIATAGFTLMTESFFLKKPYLALPMKGQFEQVLNGLMLNELNYGRTTFDLKKEDISAFLYDIPEFTENLQNYKQKDNSAIREMLDLLLANDQKLLRRYHDKRRTIFNMEEKK